jgi:hypothetical protein
MMAYLPSDAALFLLTYEFAQTIADHIDLLGKSTFGMGGGREFYMEQLGLMASGTEPSTATPSPLPWPWEWVSDP